MASGPWFYVERVTVTGVGHTEPTPWPRFHYTDLHLKPPFPNPPDPPITADSWVWASITEVGPGPDGRSHFGDALMFVGNVSPQDDGSIAIRVESSWPDDLPAMIK